MNDRLNKLYGELEYFLNNSPYVGDCSDEENQMYSDMADLKISIENLKDSMIDNKQAQKELIFSKRTVAGAKEKGYPTFNECNHYIMDMSHLDPKTKDWLNTISIKLPNDNYVTFCVMQTSKDESCIDVRFHGDNLKNHRVIAFGNNDGDVIALDKSIYALIAHSNE